jgi:hypothetical protein
MATVVVRRHQKNGWLIFQVEQGAEYIQKLPGFKGTRFSIPEKQASAGPGSPSTMLAACYRLGGDAWHADLSWEIVDEHDNIIADFKAFSERGGTFDEPTGEGS